MKQLIYRPLLLALVTACLCLPAQAEQPGRVDFGKFTPPGQGNEFVDVHVRSNLLALAAKLVEKEQPDAAELLRSVELVQVYVVGLTEDNREELLQRVQKIRQDLDGRGWERNVSVQGKKGEDVGIYTQTRGGEALAGVAVTVVDPQHVVLINVVGDIRPEQIAALGESLNINPLKEIGAAARK
jgi:Trp operon repressor